MAHSKAAPLKNFLGIGFGPIQSGLMLYEAWKSGRFGTFTILEVDAELVRAVRENGNRFSLNIAGENGVRGETLDQILLLNPADTMDAGRVAEAVKGADEMATALPSVDFYDRGETSIARLLARHASSEKKQILYASENNNFAAEILAQKIADLSGNKIPPHSTVIGNLAVLNTVIGKMCGVIRDPEMIRKLGLVPMTPGLSRAVLVESFNRILISKNPFPEVVRGITVFEEKTDLLPFEEAKLFGHNAVHALLGYLAAFEGLGVMSELRSHPRLMDFGRRAFLECGDSLILKYGRTGDPLFTQDGFSNYADDLLKRMTNPFLVDEVARIVRDPLRKLGFGDRLFGTMAESLRSGVTPKEVARGAAAAIYCLIQNQEGSCVTLTLPGIDLPKNPEDLTRTALSDFLRALWKEKALDPHAATIVDLVWEEWETLIRER